MTDSPSDTPETEENEAVEPDALAQWAEQLAGTLDAEAWSADHGTVQITVDRTAWRDAATKARDKAGLNFFSWLSATDWSREVTVGEPASDVEDLEERFDVQCRLSSVANANGAILVASVPKDDPVIDSLVTVFGGAAWHEREAAEMFGLRFTGHPHLVNIYLPDEFEGHPLRKSFPLLAREVKPWPGTVDVEGMPEDGPSTENTEAAAVERGAE
ncbi:MAG: NADH-quinone oxidoreductase subunit C [Acidimicrobiia bacterium]|nr:NADH-quinone oxidoreductase subunit C [Acidimicrobiia bacterium]